MKIVDSIVGHCCKCKGPITFYVGDMCDVREEAGCKLLQRHCDNCKVFNTVIIFMKDLERGDG